MTESTLHPIFGVIIVLAGLALAVFAGMVLYKDDNQESASRKKSSQIQPINRPLKIQKKGEVF